jgi:DNA mismatch repair ATPase MutS
LRSLIQQDSRTSWAAAADLLLPGACPKSYGTNVARLAGLPASVVARAGAISAQREDSGSSSQPHLLAGLRSLLSQLKPLKQQQQQQEGGAECEGGPGTPAAAGSQSVPWRQLQQQAQQLVC